MTRVLATMSINNIREEAEATAMDVLRAHWPEQSFPVDPIKIARRMGVEVFTAELGNDVFGLIVGTYGAGASIYLDADQPQVRMRFTVAHELGHFAAHELHDAPDSQLDFVDKRSDSDRGEPAEVWANHFAGALLMPRQALLQYKAETPSEWRLASIFGVSQPALRYRLALVGS